MGKKTIRDIMLRGMRVLVRVDLNVPLDSESGEITDDTRIRAVLPTIKYLIDNRSKVILASHLGRPGGKVVEALRLFPVVEQLSELLELPVVSVDDCVGPKVKQAVEKLRPGEVLLLDNLRFHPEEERNDPNFARALARLADVFVNDAFGAAHRAHASTVGVAQHLPAVAGFLMEKELEVMGKALTDPARPFAAIIGGAKVSDKLGLLENILTRVDSLLIGGGMCCTFLKARGYGVGQSSVEEDKLSFALNLTERALKNGVHVLLPTDLVVAASFDAQAEYKVVAVTEVPQSWYIMDIGPETRQRFGSELGRCQTIIWNGPMGVFEMPQFQEGTRAIATALAEAKATTVVGGGSTAEAVQKLGLVDKMTHVSTGGGAALRLLEGEALPAVAVLQDKD